MAKKSSSGIPYIKPFGKPSYSFSKEGTVVDVYYASSKPVEVYQTMNGHTQRVTMSRNDYENFENRLKSNGFKQHENIYAATV
mgnify:CR=1 FL=1